MSTLGPHIYVYIYICTLIYIGTIHIYIYTINIYIYICTHTRYSVYTYMPSRGGGVEELAECGDRAPIEASLKRLPWEPRRGNPKNIAIIEYEYKDPGGYVPIFYS